MEVPCGITLEAGSILAGELSQVGEGIAPCLTVSVVRRQLKANFRPPIHDIAKH